MRKLFLVAAAACFLFSSCDKVENTSSQGNQSGYELYPLGDSTHYAQNAWPTFSANTSDDRSVLIEDYTGHKCIFCPAAAAAADSLKNANAGRVVVMGIHSGPTGIEAFQTEDAEHPAIFYNELSEALGQYFGMNWPASQFIGNPFGSISRRDNGNGTPMEGPFTWSNSVDNIIQANDNKVRLQAMSNYYPSTRGLFLHTEIEVVDQALTNELRVVAYLVEDEFESPQDFPGGITQTDYMHHDILRASIDGTVWGQELDAEHLDNGKYYFNYIYEVPEAYAGNSHAVIFVRDADTEEVYQVIKHEF